MVTYDLKVRRCKSMWIVAADETERCILPSPVAAKLGVVS
jgi:hypothetical protein